MLMITSTNFYKLFNMKSWLKARVNFHVLNLTHININYGIEYVNE